MCPPTLYVPTGGAGLTRKTCTICNVDINDLLSSLNLSALENMANIVWKVETADRLAY